MKGKELVLGFIVIAFALSVFFYPVAARITPESTAPITTSLTITGPSGSVTVNSQVIFTVKLSGSWYELTGIVRNKLIIVFLGSGSGQCTTGLDGACQVPLTTPSVAGSYTATAQFTGDSNFQSSSTSMPLTVVSVSNAQITVNLRLLTYKTVTVLVQVCTTTTCSTGTIKAQAFLGLSPGNPTSSKVFTVTSGTFFVRISGYGIVTQVSLPLTVPPDQTVNFNIA